MATNQYFNLHNNTSTSEQDMIHDLTIEVIQQKGMDIEYLPRTLQKEDKIFGEDVLSSFDVRHTIEVMIMGTDGFEGGQDIFGRFGLAIKDQTELAVSSRRFTEVSGMPKPMEGDLIYVPMTNGLFEIKFVEDEKPFYVHGELPQYIMRVEQFDYSHETFNTGLTELDTIDDIFISDDVTLSADESQNEDIQTEGDAVSDWTEGNPFGTW